MNFEDQQHLIPKTEQSPSLLDQTEEGVKTPLDENKYQQFSESRKALWAETGVNPLVESERAKHFAETDLETEKQSFERFQEKAENLRVDIDEKKSRLNVFLIVYRIC